MSFRVIDTISLLKFSKGHNYIKNAGRVTFLILCILSDGASRVASFVKISQRVSELLL